MTYNELWQPLTACYAEGEARAIVRTVLDVRFGLSLTDIYCGKVTQLSADHTARLQEIMARLQQGEPVQYVLGEAPFCHRDFHVEPGVLIPRPETGELCRWIARDEPHAASLLDIGCGSGCIAVTLALELPGARVQAWDVSPAALQITRLNADRLGAAVEVVEQDALCPPRHESRWDVIVSNPPYICREEQADMAPNVADHEPAPALFVPDDDPLRFYRAIARYATQALRPGGALYFEINARFGTETAALLRSEGLHEITLRRDTFGKDRMVRARRK